MSEAQKRKIKAVRIERPKYQKRKPKVINDNWKRCNECSQANRCSEHSFAGEYPELMENWDWLMNNNSGIDPYTLAPSSGKRAWFICYNAVCERKCIHSWRTSLDHIVSGCGCPYCSTSKKRVCPCDSLQTRFPEIANQITSDEHGNYVHTDELPCYSSKVYEFLCDNVTCEKGCLHTWTTSISNRVNGGTGCPYCCTQPTRICECNSLFHKRPDLMTEWNYDDNTHLNPKLLFPASHTYCAWRCGKCGHKYTAMLSHRSTSGTGCRVCATRPRECSAVNKIQKWLRDNGFIVEREATFPDLYWKRPLRFDFRVNQNIIIEFDGAQHFKPFWGDKTWSNIRHRDKIKNKYCMTNALPFLRISYTSEKEIPAILVDFMSECEYFCNTQTEVFRKRYGREFPLRVSDPVIYNKLAKEGAKLDKMSEVPI